ncbi:MAG: aldehyde dehydrogenase family protein [Rhizobiales bacterium]|nr:aldehyde dehydrogenase family protein [Hyphomicrobiales bacterium]
MCVLRSRRVPGRALLRQNGAKKLRDLAELVKPKAEELGRTETIDTGKLFRETRWQANNVATMYKFYCGLADKVNGYVPPLAPDQNLM